MLALAAGERRPRHVIHTRDVYIAPKARWTLVGATTERNRGDTVVDRTAIDLLRARGAGAGSGSRPTRPNSPPGPASALAALTTSR